MNAPYPTRPFPTGNGLADRHAMVEYRWQCARADYQIACSLGVILPGPLGEREIIAQLYSAYVIADGRED